MEVASEYQTPERMAKKQQAIPLPDMKGKRVLDVGCDFGFWCSMAKAGGAACVVGLDRGRHVRGIGFVDLVNECKKSHPGCDFFKIDVGRQWHEFGKFDLIFLFSLYHHIYESAGGDHAPIWYWLWRHLDKGGVVLWENPVDTQDNVVKINVSAEYHRNYHEDAILTAANRYFHIEYVGPALHEPTRKVYKFTRQARMPTGYVTIPKPGSGGATRAFLYSNKRRVREIAEVLNHQVIPGSLNLSADSDFDWDHGYYRSRILDVADRGKGLDSLWTPRWARFYRVKLDQYPWCWAFRFEGENYARNFIEVISGKRLRDLEGVQDGMEVSLWTE